MDKDNTLTVGIPRAMLYHRYGTLWQTFFDELGVRTVLSPPSNREILERGSALSVDESCLSNKLFLGHVEALMGKCDGIFIPRYSSLGRAEVFCSRFESLYDQTTNIFRGTHQRFLTCNVDVLKHHSEEEAFEGLGRDLGFSGKKSRKAYAAGVKADEKLRKERLQKQEARLREPGMKILIAGHSYILSDAYVGRPILEYLNGMDVTVLRGDVVEREAALKESERFSPTCRWLMNREFIGNILLNRDKLDGIILVSAFPCGGDAMINELLTRRIQDIPLLNLVLDEQSGMAGIETRLESFIDIIRFTKGEAV